MLIIESNSNWFRSVQRFKIFHWFAGLSWTAARTWREEKSKFRWILHCNKSFKKSSHWYPRLKLTANISYGLNDVPPWYLCLFMALQHYMTMIGAIVAIPFILTPALCMADDDPARTAIISTMLLVTGLVTLIQTIFGCRYVKQWDINVSSRQ